jgi:PilZ domain
MYDKQRSDERFALTTKCHLDMSGITYDCLVDNISANGASIDITLSDHGEIREGEMGTLHVLLLTPVTYSCKVVRIDSNRIGLQFTGN